MGKRRAMGRGEDGEDDDEATTGDDYCTEEDGE